MHRVTAGGAWAAHLLGTELYARAGVGSGVYHVTLHHQHGVSGATLGRCHLSGGPASQSDCVRIGHTRAPSWYLGRRLTPGHQSLGTSHAGACNNACSVYAASRGACHRSGKMCCEGVQRPQGQRRTLARQDSGTSHTRVHAWGTEELSHGVRNGVRNVSHGVRNGAQEWGAMVYRMVRRWHSGPWCTNSEPYGLGRSYLAHE